MKGRAKETLLAEERTMVGSEVVGAEENSSLDCQ